MKKVIPEKEVEKVVAGIDFGTTNSGAVVFYNGKILRYGESINEPLPSVIAISKKNGDVKCGKDALNVLEKDSKEYEVFSDIKTIILGSHEDITIGDQNWKPVDFAAFIFKTLKQSVYDYTEGTIEIVKAVVAIPVGFNREKRKILREAARKEGIEIINFITEPTAAFVSNYKNIKGTSNAAVFDWGGGTLDVSIIEYKKGYIKELATYGDNFAGNDIDKKMSKELHNIIEGKKKLKYKFEDLPGNVKHLMLHRIEEAKKALSSKTEATIELPYGPYKIIRETITRKWMSNLIEKDIENAISCLDTALKFADKSISGIDKIILTGGSSKLKVLQKRMIDHLHSDNSKIVIPEDSSWDVSEGAFKYALNLLEKENMMPKPISNVCLILDNNGATEQYWIYGEKVKKQEDQEDGNSNVFWFGLTDTTQQARFVFGGEPGIDNCDDKRRTLDVNCLNFLEEKIRLEVLVDDDLVFIAKASGDMLSHNVSEKDAQTIFEYPNLKFKYPMDLDNVKY